MNVTTDFVTAAPTPTSWSGVFGYKPDQPSQLEFLGEMFGVISIKSEIEFDLSNLGNLLQDEVHDSYYGPATGPAELARFERAVKSVARRIGQIMERESELAQQGVDFEMMVCVIRDNFLYMGVVGESKIVVARGADAAEISGVLIDAELDGFARTGSLQLDPNDRFMLLTSGAYAEIKQTGVDQSLANFSIKDKKLKTGSLVMLGYELSEEYLASLQPEIEEVEEVAPVRQVAGTTVLSSAVAAEEEEQDEILEDEEDFTEEDEDNYDGIEDEYDEQPSAVDKVKAGVGGLIGNLRSKMMRQPEAESEMTDEDLEEDLLIDEEEGQEPDEYEDEPQYQDQKWERPRSVVPAGVGAAGGVGAILNTIREKGEDLLQGDTASKVMQQVKGLFTKAKQGIRDLRHGRPGNRQTFAKGGKRGGLNIETKWKLLGVVLIVAVVIVFFGIRQTIADNEKRAFEQGIKDTISQYETELEQLVITANTISIGESDDTQITQVSNQFDQLSQKATALKSNQIDVDRLDVIIEQIQIEKDTLLRVNGFTQAQVVTDLAVNFQGVETADIDYSRGNIYVADKGRGVIYKIGTEIGAEAKNFATGLVAPRLISVEKDGDIVFVDAGSESVVGQVDIDNGTVRRQPGLNAATIGPITNMFVWDNNQAMYVIHPSRRAIVRRDSVDGNYALGDGETWRQDPKFADAKDLAVNGSVYALIAGEGIKRYFAGEPGTFSIRGLTPELESAVNNAIAFELTSNRVYLLDRAGKRIIVLSLRNANKAIYEYEEQIVYRGTEEIFTDLKDLVVVPGTGGGRVFVLDGSRIIRIDR